MQNDAQDRRLPASARKIERARREGQVARSRDLGHFAALGLGLWLIGAFAAELTGFMQRLLAAGLRFDAASVASPQSMVEALSAQSVQMLVLLLPLGLLMLVLALAAGLLSGGWNFTWQAMEPKIEKIGLISGLKRLFSGENLLQTLKACLVALVLGVVGAAWLMVRWPELAALGRQPLPAALAAGGALLGQGLLVLAGVLALSALVDVPLQRQMLLRRLRMSVEELKKEMREQEGSPEIKGRLRQRMRELAGRRMLSQVPMADLVVMNPTHYAVALKYDPLKTGAPRVVAKGADLLALRIRDLAREHQVPVLQHPPLARALYAHCDLDQEIPARLFAAVAHVLAWVFQLRDAVAAGRRADMPAPEPEVPADMDPLATPANPAPAATAAGAGGER
jgi:flagellar biosynthetic protein FlhB